MGRKTNVRSYERRDGTKVSQHERSLNGDAPRVNADTYKPPKKPAPGEVIDKVTIRTSSPGYWNTRERLLKRGYKVSGTGDGTTTFSLYEGRGEKITMDELLSPSKGTTVAVLDYEDGVVFIHKVAHEELVDQGVEDWVSNKYDLNSVEWVEYNKTINHWDVSETLDYPYDENDLVDVLALSDAGEVVVLTDIDAQAIETTVFDVFDKYDDIIGGILGWTQGTKVVRK